MDSKIQSFSSRALFEREADLISGGNGRFPGFYQCKAGLRFELSPDVWDPVTRYYVWDREQALRRAMAICERLPAPVKLLRLETFPSERYARSQKKSMSRLCERAGLGRPMCIARAKECAVDDLHGGMEMEEGELFYWRLTSSFRLRSLLGELYSDRYFTAFNRQSVFLIDTRTHVAFHPFEEGADVTALDPRTILYLYKELNDWILEYDRKRIDAVFAGLSDESSGGK